MNNDNISSIGKEGLIKRIVGKFSIKHPSTVVGIGDDAAVLDYRHKPFAVATSFFSEGIHFNLTYTPLKHLGYKISTVSFSNIFAMNALPRQILVSLAVSSKYKLSMIDELYEGISRACVRYGVDLVGGEITSSYTGLNISITAIGELLYETPVLRNGAKINDLICVSGNVGAAYVGLQILQREAEVFNATGEQPDLENYSYVVERQLKPEARGDIIELLHKLSIIPTSMIDISKGLAIEIIKICESSNKGCNVYLDKIPIDPETKKVSEELNIDSLIPALHGGEDYELLFTIPLASYELIKDMPQISIIGHIIEKEKGMNFVTSNGSSIKFEDFEIKHNKKN